MANRTRIQNLLVETAQSGLFYAVDYDSNTRLATVDKATIIAPSSVRANETASTYAEAALNRRSRLRERETWTFKLLLAFDREVSFEVFENALADNPLRLPLSVPDGLRQVTLELVDSEYEHPRQQQSSTGSQATLTFEADLSPR